MSTAASRRSARRALCTLVVLLFVVVQAAALAHEIQHVMHLHEGPCGLHVVADHLSLAPAPVPALAVGLVPAAAPWSWLPSVGPEPPARPSVALAPPSLS